MCRSLMTSLRRGRAEALTSGNGGERGDQNGFFPGRPYPHSGHTRFVTGSSERSSSNSEYTRWRPRPDTRRACLHRGHLYVVAV
jgi:hypothetical protein